MNKKRLQDADSPPPQDGVEPPPRPDIGRGHPEFHFVQAIMELKTTIHQMDTDQKVSMARMEEKMSAMKESVDSTKKKVDDLTKWRFTIGGALLILGFMVGVLLRFGDRITILPPGGAVTPPSAQSAPQR